MDSYNSNATYGVDLNNLESAIFEIRDGVAIVTLNRPEALNSLNTAIHRDVGACWEEINNNDDIKAAVVVGSGRFFCAGRDIKEFVGTYGEGEAAELRKIDDPDGEMFGRLANHWHVKKPLVGALQGSAVGGGLEVAIMCDMIVMAEDAYIADLHAKINVGGMVSMNTFLPPNIARELTMTDRRLTAEECFRYGFANYVLSKDQVLEKAIEVAQATALMGPESIQRLKQGSIDLQLASGNLHGEEFYEERRKIVRAQMAETAGDHDRMEGMKAFVEKRDSAYERPVTSNDSDNREG